MTGPTGQIINSATHPGPTAALRSAGRAHPTNRSTRRGPPAGPGAGNPAFADSEIKRLMPPLQISQSIEHEFPFERR